jgi:hypothetical protein
MPIRQFLNGHKFDHDTILTMGVAFEMARASTTGGIGPILLMLQSRNLAQAGERNVDQLCDRALAILSATPPPL